MPLFKALGFGVLLIILKLMLPNVLTEGERTAVLFLKGASASALTATELVEHADIDNTRSTLRLPQAPSPVSF